MRTLSSSSFVVCLLLAITGLNPVETQGFHVPDDETVIVEGPLLRAVATQTEIPQAAGGGDTTNKRYLIPNCVVVESSTSMSIVSQVSDENDEEATRLQLSTGVTTSCTVEVTTTVSAPLRTRLWDRNLAGRKEARKTKCPKGMGKTTDRFNSMRLVCVGCIKTLSQLVARMAIGGTINICDKTTITVLAPLRLSANPNTKISCCNECAVARNSRCVLQAGFAGDMFLGYFLNKPIVRFELERMAIDGNSIAGAAAAQLTNVNFVLTKTLVEDFESTTLEVSDSTIRVEDGSMTATESVVQNNLSGYGAVELTRSMGNFTETEFSENKSTEANQGGAVTIDGALASANFVRSTFSMNTAQVQAGADIGAVNAATATCDDATICNNNSDKVFIAGTVSPTCTAMVTCPK